VQPHRDSPGAEGLAEMPETPGDRGAAVSASSRIGERVAQYLVPIALDHGLATARAISGAAATVMHIARVDVMQPGIERDAARA